MERAQTSEPIKKLVKLSMKSKMKKESKLKPLKSKMKIWIIELKTKIKKKMLKKKIRKTKILKIKLRSKQRNSFPVENAENYSEVESK